MLVYKIKYHGEAEIYGRSEAEVRSYWKEAVGLDEDDDATLDSVEVVGDVCDDLCEEFQEEDYNA